MSHLFKTLGHYVAITLKVIILGMLITLLAIYLLGNTSAYAAGALISGLSPLIWMAIALSSFLIISVLTPLPKTNDRRAHHDND